MEDPNVRVGNNEYTYMPFNVFCIDNKHIEMKMKVQYAVQYSI